MPRAKTATKRQADSQADNHNVTPKKAATSKTRGKAGQKPAPAASDTSTPNSQAQVMSAGNLREKLFAQYQDFERTDGSSVISPEGFERLSNDLGFDMAKIEPLVLMWKVGCTELGTVSYASWQDSLAAMNVSSTSQLRKATDEAVKQMATDAQMYKTFYRRMFDYLKPGKQKTISAEFAKGVLPVIKRADNKVFDKFVKFLDAHGDKVKTINRDQWQSLLELSQTMDESLSEYSKDDAWPALFDDFADWVQKQPAEAEGGSDMVVQ